MLRDQESFSKAVVRGAGQVPSVRESATAVVVAAGTTEFSFDRATGRLASVTVSGAPVSFSNGPRPVSGDVKLTKLDTRPDGQDIVVEATYDGPLRAVRWRVRGNGWLTLHYDMRVAGGSHPFFGVTFDYPAEQVTGMRWLGRGPHRVWKNRLDGPTFGVWSSAVNDAITGEVWAVPRVPGFYADLYWATIGTRQQPVTIVAETPGMFLRVLTPREPKDPRNTKLAFPDGDISFLHGIPPMGTKFHAAATYGPESQMNLVNGRTGAYSATLHFKFGPVTGAGTR